MVSTETMVQTPVVEPKILTVLLKIKTIKDNPLPQIMLLDKISANGFLKNKTGEINLAIEGSLIVQIIDRQGIIIKEEQLPNPLQKQYETADEEGKLQSHPITLEAEVFSVRIQRNPELTSLKIYIIKDRKRFLLKQVQL